MAVKFLQTKPFLLISEEQGDSGPLYSIAKDAKDKWWMHRDGESWTEQPSREAALESVGGFVVDLTEEPEPEDAPAMAP